MQALRLMILWAQWWCQEYRTISAMQRKQTRTVLLLVGKNYLKGQRDIFTAAIVHLCSPYASDNVKDNSPLLQLPNNEKNMSTTKHIILCLILSLTTAVMGYAVSRDFTNAFDAAIQDLVADPVWTKYYADNMFLPVPQCTTKVAWPTNNPFIGRDSLVMCFENGTLTPWKETKTELATSVVKKVNAHYGTNYKLVIKRYDTSKYGFFDTMRMAVDSGECDMVTANTRPSADRELVAHFQCGFGSASKGMGK